MSRKIRSLNRSLSYLSNLQCHSFRISLCDLSVSPLPTFTSNSPRMDADDSMHTNFNTISQFNNSDIDTQDEFQNSEPSLSIFCNPPSIQSILNFPMKPAQPLVLTPTQLQYFSQRPVISPTPLATSPTH